MALNPGSEDKTEIGMVDFNRADLVQRLRAHAQIESYLHKVDLISAAEEIERLAKRQRADKSEALRAASTELRAQMDGLAEMMDDPYKAPEQTIELLPLVMQAMWNFQIEWVVLNRV